MHFYYLNIKEVLIRLGHATDQKRHLGLIRLRIFKMRWVSVANDDLELKPLISDSATRRSLWPLECQPVALDDKWQISKTLIQSSIQTHGQVGKKSYFDIWHFWKSYCWFKAHMRTWSSEPEPELEPPEPVHFARSRNRRTVILGAGAGARAGLLPRSRSRSRPKMSRRRIPGRNPMAHLLCHKGSPLCCRILTRPTGVVVQKGAQEWLLSLFLPQEMWPYSCYHNHHLMIFWFREPVTSIDVCCMLKHGTDLFDRTLPPFMTSVHWVNCDESWVTFESTLTPMTWFRIESCKQIWGLTVESVITSASRVSPKNLSQVQPCPAMPV